MSSMIARKFTRFLEILTWFFNKKWKGIESRKDKLFPHSLINA
jgi:hypothetical protein